jgi:nucleotide-binding universal stress UspA family protein
MMLLKNILVAMDFSDTSHAALQQARELADALQASLHVLHVVTEPLHEAWAGYASAADFLHAMDTRQDEARDRLQADLDGDKRSPASVTVATAWGDPVEEIVKYADAHHIDLIVCGTHGRRGWEHMLMGSVAERIVRLAQCPVLTVHDEPRAASAA